MEQNPMESARRPNVSSPLANEPWRRRWRNPFIVDLALAARNPHRAVFAANVGGRHQLYGWDLQTGHHWPLTLPTDDVPYAIISADGERCYYLKSETGDGIGHYFYQSLTTGERGDISPDMPPYASFYFTECDSGAYYGFSAANQYGYMIYVIDNHAGGLPRLRYESQTPAIGPLLSYDGELAGILTVGAPDSHDLALEAWDVRTSEHRHRLWDGPGTRIAPAGFARRAGDMRLLAASNATGEDRPLIWNARTGERRDLHLPDVPGDVLPLDWSADGQHILLLQSHAGRQRLWRYAVADHAIHKIHSYVGVIHRACFHQDANRILALTETYREAPHIRELRLAWQKEIPARDMLLGPSFPDLRWWEEVAFTSGSARIQAWLRRPRDDKALPAILMAHGGPEDAQYPGWSSAVASWLDAGYAVLSVNYRGSASFGSAFRRAILGQPCQAEVDDLIAGAQWMLDEGIALPGQVFVGGAAYGGTLALLALGRAPHLFAGALASAPIVDWQAFYEVSDAAVQASQRRLFGGPPVETAQVTAHASPRTHIAHIRRPVLLLHHPQDPRYPFEQTQAYAVALAAQGGDVQLLMHPEEALTQEAQFACMLAFTRQQISSAI